MPSARAHQAGTVYLLHFDRPYKHAQHYLGWAADLDTRLAAHRAGNGARLITVIAAAGISWQLARTWPGATEGHEKALEDLNSRKRLCPVCTPGTRSGTVIIPKQRRRNRAR